MDINKYFDKIYLLNLHRRKDRLNKSLEKLQQFDIEVEVFGAVDGSVLNHLFNKLDNPRFLNTGYLGSTISHLSIYRDALSNGYERILILEDDNLINKNIHQIFESQEIPEWDDLFYLGYIPLSDDLVMWTYGITMLKDQMLTDKIFKCHNLWGLYAYGITSKVMREMIDVYNSEFPMEIDRYFVNSIQKRNGSIAIGPQLFCCDYDNFSDNQGFAPDNHITIKSIDSRFASIQDYI
jgi:GR25 family glycosyltransferase involved in LPS biosynthesis